MQKHMRDQQMTSQANGHRFEGSEQRPSDIDVAFVKQVWSSKGCDISKVDQMNANQIRQAVHDIMGTTELSDLDKGTGGGCVGCS